jgi:hypothetical protein
VVAILCARYGASQIGGFEDVRQAVQLCALLVQPDAMKLWVVMM